MRDSRYGTYCGFCGKCCVGGDSASEEILAKNCPNDG